MSLVGALRASTNPVVSEPARPEFGRSRPWIPRLCLVAFRLPSAAGVMIVTCLLFHSQATPTGAQVVEWVAQFGTTDFDNGNGVSADGLGYVYVSGTTRGNLGGTNIDPAYPDAFVSKFDDAGNLLWNRQLGGEGTDEALAVSADGLGNVYISGVTYGSLGGANAGQADAFVSKYDDAGNLLWTQQLGTDRQDSSFAISADGLGNIYISGYTYGGLEGASAYPSADAFVTKYDTAGNVLWTRQLGTEHFDSSYGVSADGLGNVYISGGTRGILGNSNAGAEDAFVSKYDDGGNLLWTRQLGSAYVDRSRGVSADDLGNVYVAGYTVENLAGVSAGDQDAFLLKYDAAGNFLWGEQFGTAYQDRGYSVSTDGLGNAYVSGHIAGDAFVRKYDGGGNLLWIQQLGSSAHDKGQGISADGFGNVYVAGTTYGVLGSASVGKTDAFLAKLVTFSSLLGDFDADGDVDGRDFLVWQRGESPDPLSATDLSSWQTNYGAVSSPSNTTNVPEPSSLLMLLTACFLVPYRHRKSEAYHRVITNGISLYLLTRTHLSLNLFY